MKFFVPECCIGAYLYLRIGETGKMSCLRLAVEVTVIPAEYTIQHTSLAIIYVFWTVAMD